jgi:hypothetical protein
MNEDDEDQNIGFQDPDAEDMPSEMKDHMLAAFQHGAGLGPHPGKYTGPTKRPGAGGPPTETDLQRAREEEANAEKMHAAQTGGSGDLGPTQMESQQSDQGNKLEQQATTQGQAKASQAQSQMAPVNPPEAPGSAVGQSQPYRAQAGPQPQAPAEPPQALPPPPPQAPGPEEAPGS